MSSPRARRLAADYQAVKALCRESTILDLSASGDPPSVYLLKFSGRGLAMNATRGPYEVFEHEVRIRLGTNYPRSIPELHWLTPIFHPNISANGLVCLGGYTTNWVPSLKLDDLCIMLWDMIRYRNFDTSSPYNRLAAEWARSQRQFILPLDNRALRDNPIPLGNSAAGDSANRMSGNAENRNAEKIVRQDDLSVVDAEMIAGQARNPDAPASHRGWPPQTDSSEITFL